jgi:hypothetical protein
MSEAEHFPSPQHISEEPKVQDPENEPDESKREQLPVVLEPHELAIEEEKARELIEEWRKNFEQGLNSLFDDNRGWGDTTEINREIRNTVADEMLQKKVKEIAAAAGYEDFESLPVQRQLTYYRTASSEMNMVSSFEQSSGMQGSASRSPGLALLNNELRPDQQRKIAESSYYKIGKSELMRESVFFRQLLQGAGYSIGTAENWQFILSLAVDQPVRANTYVREITELEQQFLTDHADVLELIQEGVNFSRRPDLSAVMKGRLFAGQATIQNTSYDRLFRAAGLTDPSRETSERALELRGRLEEKFEKLRGYRLTEIRARLEAMRLNQELPQFDGELKDVRERIQEITRELALAQKEKINTQKQLDEAGILSWKVKGAAKQELDAINGRVGQLQEESSNLQLWEEALASAVAELGHEKRENYYTDTEKARQGFYATDSASEARLREIEQELEVLKNQPES